MIERLKKGIASYKTTILLLLLYALLLGVATWVEKFYSSEVAKRFFYHSPLLILLYILLVCNFVATTCKKKLFQKERLAYLAIHGAFLVILAGALISFLFSEEGLMPIREGESSSTIFIREGKKFREKELPFSLELRDFRLIRYPGSGSPSSYESDIIVHRNGTAEPAAIYMNNVLDVGGYRFFQASYDEDEKGTILSVSNDLVGTVVTYVGYLLLCIGFLWLFFEKNGLFRRLLKQLSSIQRLLGVVPFILLATTAFAETIPAVDKPIPEDHARLFGELPIQWQGRVVPMNTVSSEVLRKVHKESTIAGLSSDQFLLSFLAELERWIATPFIETPNDEVAIATGLSPDYFAFAEAFDEEGNYTLYAQVERAYRTPLAEQTALEKGLLKVDERISLLHALSQLQLLAIFPNANDPTHKWYATGEDLHAFQNQADSLFVATSFQAYLHEVRQALTTNDWHVADKKLLAIKQFQLRADRANLINPSKIKAEVRYNESRIFARCRVLYLALGGILLGIALGILLRGKESKAWRVASQIASFLILLVLGYHGYGMGLRWYIGGYAPWSNSYETMVYVALATALAGFILGRKSIATRALATLLAGVILFVSGLNWMDPQIGTLVPVLKSPWLMFHVAVIVAAYGFFGIGALLGIVNLLLAILLPPLRRTKLHIMELTIISKLALMLGLALMTVGTFLGAVWANESWGRYWGWDPKETWALITMICYTVVVHLHLIPTKHSLWLYNVVALFAIASVLMTFFGVNYFLAGMHSYGYSGGISNGFTLVLVGFGLLALLATLALPRFKRLFPQP